MVAERGADLIRGRLASRRAGRSVRMSTAQHPRAGPRRRALGCSSTTIREGAGEPLVLIHGIGLRWRSGDR